MRTARITAYVTALNCRRLNVDNASGARVATSALRVRSQQVLNTPARHFALVASYRHKLESRGNLIVGREMDS
eukprot:4446339-Pyramimonas_sp.AAC.1